MFPMRPSLAARLGAACFLAARVASACDVCAIYNTTELGETRPGLRLSVAEQWTRFATWKLDGETVPNPGERLLSSITQVVAGYGIHPRFALQLNLPIISRTFRRFEQGRLTHGDETGIGDLALVGNWRAWSLVTEESVFHVSLLGGIEFPTGNPDRLGEELAEPQAQTAPAAHAARSRFRPLHATGGSGGGSDGGTDSDTAVSESGIHGHDLALGSGSYDGIVGGSVLWTWRRFLVTAGGQYTIRGGGAFDYRFANDLTWTAAPGVYALLSHTQSLAVQAVFSGETKGNDTQAGVHLDDTAITALYLGPSLAYSRGTRLYAEVAADLPVLQHNTSLQIVPDYRVRGGLTWRF
jgi:hypothetical protein